MIVKTPNKSLGKVCYMLMCILLCLSLIAPLAAYGADVKVTATPDSIYLGDEVTVSGKADPGVWISIKALESDGSIVYFNSMLSNSEGDFSDIFKLDDISPGPIILVVGYGSNTRTASITVKPPIGSENNTNNSGNSIFIPSYKVDISSPGAPGKTLPIKVDANKSSAELDLGPLENSILAKDATITINMPPIPNVRGYTLRFPTVPESSLLGQGKIRFSTDLGSIIIPNNMFSNIPGIQGKAPSITIKEANKDLLSNEERKAIGDRPLVELTLKLDDEQVSWNNPEAPVYVSIPYTPTAMELLDPEHIVILYIDGQGKVSSIPNGRYDISEGKVTFTTTHFSYYGVSYVKKTFHDLSGVKWAQKPIEVMASKGIIKGTSLSNYSPEKNINRGDFILLLVKTLGLNAEFDSNFDDVKQSDYYYEALGIAKKLDISKGLGSNLFNPKGNISRQDMMVLTARSLEKLQIFKSQGTTSILDKFTDKSAISPYAMKNLSDMVKEGLVTGSDDKLKPFAYATRGESAVFLYRIYNWTGKS